MLDSLIAEALANNKNVKIATANIEQAAGILVQTRAPLFPQVGYSGNAARQRASESNATPLPSTLSNPQTALSLFAGATWEIDLWGRIRRLSEAARANLLATEEARRGVILSLVAGVADNYLQLRGLDEQLSIARRTLVTYGESVRLFELQFKYGQISKMTVEQARTQYETAAAAIPQIEVQIAQTENALSHPPRAKSGADRPRQVHLRDCASRHSRRDPFPVAGTAAGYRPERAEPDRRQRTDRSGQGPLFPDHLTHRQLWPGKRRAFQSFQGAGPDVELCGVDHRTDFHRRGDFRSGSTGRGGPPGRAPVVRVLDTERVRRRRKLAGRSRQDRGADSRPRNDLSRRPGNTPGLRNSSTTAAIRPISRSSRPRNSCSPPSSTTQRSRASLFTSFVNIYKALGGGWVADTPVMNEASSPSRRR